MAAVSGGDAVITLRLNGSHGPTYFERTGQSSVNLFRVASVQIFKTAQRKRSTIPSFTLTTWLRK